MKKLLYSLALVACLIACSDDDKNPSFSKESLFGTWAYTEKDGDCTDLVKIDDTKFYTGSDCGSGAKFDSGDTYNYADNTITSPSWSSSGFEVKYVVVSVSATALTLDGYLNGAKIATQSYVKK